MSVVRCPAIDFLPVRLRSLGQVCTPCTPNDEASTKAGQLQTHQLLLASYA